MSKRTDAIRKVLDLMDANPGVLDEVQDLKYLSDSKAAHIHFQEDELSIHMPYFWDDEDREAEKTLVRLVLRAFGGTWDKSGSSDGGTMYFKREGIFGHLNATIFANRAAVCERVVTGTKTVEHARVNAVKAFTETVDVVEWQCMPLLGETAEAEAKELVNA